jgi:hypothetical protein
MIIWIASYPKAGNTIVRSLLASYFFSEDGNFDFDLLNNIRQFPDISLFKKLQIDTTNEKEVVKNYINAQKLIIKKGSINFLKTHSSLFNINNNHFTDLHRSLGAIYIVRDPRNVVRSYANHFQVTEEEAATHLTEQRFSYGMKNLENQENRVVTHLGSWSFNYNSWTSFKTHKRYLLVKYEDLISNKEKILIKILKFVHKLAKINFVLDKNKLKNILESTSFEKMQDLEIRKGFSESVIAKKTGNKINFFNLGPKNDWKKFPNVNVKKQIENFFEKEMRELGYL